jgi:hypothetical protein
MKIIELKIDEQPHRDINSGKKTFEVRERRDRDFQVGDVLHLRRTKFTGKEMKPQPPPIEMDNCTDIPGKPLIYTGHESMVRITYILENAYGLPKGLCVMSTLLLTHKGVEQ